MASGYSDVGYSSVGYSASPLPEFSYSIASYTALSYTVTVVQPPIDNVPDTANFLDLNFLDTNYNTGVVVIPPPPPPPGEEPPPITVPANDPYYLQPLMVKVVIQNLAGTTTLYTYDSFTQETNTLALTLVEVVTAVFSTGTFRLEIEASRSKTTEAVIDYPNTNVFLGDKVTIYAGRTQASYKPIFSGYVRNVDVRRPATNRLQFVVKGYGSKVILTERILNYRRIARRLSSTSALPDKNDPSATAWQLVTDVFTDSDILPLGVPVIQSQGNFNLSGINPRVKDFIASLISFQTPANQVVDQVADLVGGVWDIDPTGKVIFDYARNISSGITVKDHVDQTDLAVNTSYFYGSWEWTDSMDISQGFANRLFSMLEVTATASSVTAGASTASSTPLSNGAIAQRFDPGASRFSNIALTLSRTGTLPKTDDVLYGAVVKDVNNNPTGTIAATFSVLANTIDTSATPVFNFTINYTSVIDTSVNAKYWIVLYKIGPDSNNTINWHNDGNTTTFDRYSAVGTPGLKTDTATTWTVSSRGPTYDFSAFTSATHTVEATDPFSTAKFGYVDATVNLPWIADRDNLDDALHIMLATSAKPKRTYTMAEVSIPDKLFEAGKTITIVDTKSGLQSNQQITAEIQQVRYVFSASGGNEGIGAWTCEITPVGFLDLNGVANISIASSSQTDLNQASGGGGDNTAGT